jgi:hypothetical protein
MNETQPTIRQDRTKSLAPMITTYPTHAEFKLSMTLEMRVSR